MFVSWFLLNTIDGTTNLMVDVAIRSGGNARYTRVLLMSTVAFGLAVFCWRKGVVSVVLSTVTAMAVDQLLERRRRLLAYWGARIKFTPAPEAGLDQSLVSISRC